MRMPAISRPHTQALLFTIVAAVHAEEPPLSDDLTVEKTLWTISGALGL